MNSEREHCEREIGLALARYVGYTTGAYHIIDRASDVILQFDGKPYLFEIELTQNLMRKFDIGKEYAEGIANFASGLGLITRIEQVSRVGRFVLSPLGRAYRAATSMNDVCFKQFLFTYSLFQYDSDVYGLILDLASGGSLPSGSALHSEFLRRTEELRDTRYMWLKETFPNKVLRQRIQNHVQWIGPVGERRTSLGKDFARHHATPRKGWAQRLGHLDDSGKLTQQGSELLDKLRGGQSSYFWLAPPIECFRLLRIPTQDIKGEHAPAWNLLRPRRRTAAVGEFTEKVATFMEQAFDDIRLVRANQATLDAVIPYVYFAEREAGYQIDESRLFDSIFSKKRDKFAPLSSRSSLLGHYQLRKK